MNPPLRTEDDRQALIDGAARRHDRMHRHRPRAARARREGRPVRAGADGHDRPRERVRRALHRARRCPGMLTLAIAARAAHRRRARCSSCARRGSRSARPPTSASSTSPRSWRIGEAGYESRSANCCFAGREVSGRVAADDRRRRGRLPRARLRAERRMSYVLLEDGTRFDGEAVGAPGAGHRRGRLQHRRCPATRSR